MLIDVVVLAHFLFEYIQSQSSDVIDSVQLCHYCISVLNRDDVEHLFHRAEIALEEFMSSETSTVFLNLIGVYHLLLFFFSFEHIWRNVCEDVLGIVLIYVEDNFFFQRCLALKQFL